MIKRSSKLSKKKRVIKLLELRKLIAGRDIMIVGSSPLSDFRRYRENMMIVNVNGSAGRNKIANIPDPTITFLDYEFVDPKALQEKKYRRDIWDKGVLVGANLGFVILTQSNSSKGGNLDDLTDDFRAVVNCGKRLRRWIVLLASRNFRLEKKREGYLSTGGFALAFLSLFSPKSIYLTGFSFFKDYAADVAPHFYDDKDTATNRLEDTRSHSLADSLLISSLTLRGIRIISDDKDLKPLLSNWGAK